MRFGIAFGKAQFALDAPELTPKTVGAVIRFAGARAARQIRKSADAAAAHATARIEARKAKNELLGTLAPRLRTEATRPFAFRDGRRHDRRTDELEHPDDGRERRRIDALAVDYSFRVREHGTRCTVAPGDRFWCWSRRRRNYRLFRWKGIEAMNYAQSWTMAVALKRGYPLVIRETGATEPPPPPVFVPVKTGMEPWQVAALGAGGGLVVGGLIGVLVRPRRARR